MSFVFPTPPIPINFQAIIDAAVLQLEIGLAGVVNSLITNLQTTISAVVTAALNTAVATLQTTISSVTAAVNLAISTLSGLISTIQTEISNLLTAAISNVTAILNNLLAFINDLITRIEQELASFRYLVFGGIVIVGAIGLGLLWYKSQENAVWQEEARDIRTSRRKQRQVAYTDS